jgi:hypothetical protein
VYVRSGREIPFRDSNQSWIAKQLHPSLYRPWHQNSKNLGQMQCAANKATKTFSSIQGAVAFIAAQPPSLSSGQTSHLSTLIPATHFENPAIHSQSSTLTATNFNLKEFAGQKRHFP